MRTYSYNVNGAQYDVTIESIQGQKAKLNVNGVAFDVEMLGTPLTEGQLPAVEAAAAPAAEQLFAGRNIGSARRKPD